MSGPREFHPAARDEVDDAAAWYDERRDGVGAQFVDQVEAVLRLIETAPSGGTVFRKGPYRTWRVVGFPFVVAYVPEPDRVLVLAVAHTRRRPGYWVRRLGDRR